MEEFLPSNRTVQALEVSGLARDGTVLQVPQACRVADITSWIRCFRLYVAVMAKQKPDLVAPPPYSDKGTAKCWRPSMAVV